MIRVNRRATRLDDHGFATCRSARRGAAGLRGAAAPLMAKQQPGIRQAGHAHRGEHSTSHLDPSHRTKSPSLGNLEPGSSRPMERRCWSAEEFQAAFLCRLRRASQFKRLLPAPRPGQYDRQTYVRPLTVWPAEPQAPQPPHSSCCNHNGCPATIAFGGTKPMDRRDRHDALNLSNRYFAMYLRQLSSRVFGR